MRKRNVSIKLCIQKLSKMSLQMNQTSFNVLITRSIYDFFNSFSELEIDFKKR